jgi:hypothetical protein
MLDYSMDATAILVSRIIDHQNIHPTQTIDQQRLRAADLLLLRQLPHFDIPQGMANSITHPLQLISTNTQTLGMV